MPLKRKASEGTSSQTLKNISPTKHKTKKPKIAEDVPKVLIWPDYFHSLFKIFKALNTVLAFVSSKRQLATSFSAVRSSVEGLLKHPLEVTKVAEIKALLPDLVKFSYVPFQEFQAENDHKDSSNRTDPYSGPITSASQQGSVLVLDFFDNSKSKTSSVISTTSLASASISPAGMKKLIESRNARFEQAIDELLIATPPSDDPVQMLMTAGRGYLPVDRALPAPDKVMQPIPLPDERPSMEQVILDMTNSLWYRDQIVHRQKVQARAAQTDSLNPPISRAISDAILHSKNINSLFSHQVAAINSIRNGKHVVVSTSTASGKSIIYQISLLVCLEKDPDGTAILVFPTKALAQDQMASLQKIFQSCPGFECLKVATYDGDTPQDARAAIRETVSVVLTNFDTLHASILPNEEKWRSFLKRLKILVVDELHYYTGLFGSHVAYILRRFRRVCAALGNRRMRFISCSATLENAAEYMGRLFAVDVNELEVVSTDGAPSGDKEYLLWDPPLVDSMVPALGRRSSLSEASTIMRFLMKKGVRVILFCKIRKVCELAMKTIKADLSNEGRLDILERVKAYRGGYTREDRRKIENEAFSGQLLGIIATNALELGIDIGVLDAVIMLGFPMTISNFKQQAGRAGRRSRDSLAILIADPFPIDQHFIQHPSELFESSLDDLVLDIDNELILEAHLQCAGLEIPLNSADEIWFGPRMMDVCKSRLRRDADGWYHTHPKFLPFPCQHVSIRGAREETYTVVEVRGREAAYMLEEVECSRALFELYEGGVFLHQGETFIVNEVSHDSRTAQVLRTDVNYTTSPRESTIIEPLHTYRSVNVNDNLVQFGRLNVCTRVFGYFRIRASIILDAVDLMTPPWERETTGFWIDLPNRVLQALNLEGIDGASKRIVEW
ncbi:hypothetical protein M413DRAFT_438203 [Hebeloma cylindrosporum]|uniref:P-loop containing nucleoside triphosphate hydrolase protein n=1 Tax=Hebeloma cylindrosporum TaxID=76867 RepID=A0A0C2YH69_HEBCY|nr:hypothetical protein M413DRAFT_438203 [Hebeloma cylindrosporum h7]